MNKPDLEAPYPVERDARLPGDGLERLDPGELSRQDAEAAAQLRSEEDERAALAQLWREQQDYARAVAEHRGDSGEGKSRLVPQIVLAALIAVGILGAVAYSVQQQRISEAEALRVTGELLARQEEEERARLAVAASSEPSPKPPVESASAPPVGPSAGEDVSKADDKTRALAERIREEARRRAAAAAKKQAEAMALAEERSRAVSASTVSETPRAVQQPRPGSVIQDCPECPRLVVLPAGTFTMGSPATESGRGQDEGPQRQVAIAQPFALGRGEVTVAEFRRFTEESGYRTEAERDTHAQGCSGFVYADPAAGIPAPPAFTSWRAPGVAQAESHPVLCVSWNDARAYAQWLSRKAGKRYRLPTEAEWEYAARAGTTTSRYWGDDPAQACRYANVADQSRLQTWGFGQKHDCTDGHYFTAPAGGHAPNRFGLYDMIGNVWEWTEDCWNASYAGAPVDGSAWLAGDCAQRVERGGSWSTVPRFARSAARHKNSADYRDNLTGFRVGRNLE
ncbi:MAG TPA: formylglycine-generating enzyme family protein [Burkholderiales bacterium]|nr:formylglycine-generating enzyme family protein [Burkholderiales bacterium]